ncbi:hypothetical protein EMIHUDRAFT_456339 [Emiliania huxleyi CCMP1516]|uniref:PLD phosphodiesterase domain-containing protein n=2 Tax=Emiliania huxleyi TaxID=2903 RepID=A0A0D3K6K7_EMIH1|nr:hypothetical protein EMIHUDRAFT_459933 [Emiliania huxleyi CCMP1516]XP_005783821.1 hypothetical protein EMIHUDRAFT_456339 [Emiliania huxleyi CCMP1516]EOD08925.1 hypothetical protein EMIHUDRAFT_459933 [Emiliania huxleyi CCMP1516]EOD31392.1 hypothetical protein EMIHUDRAFT_456339 [Emiliania huxleyi CCMP1516]|eukprot:XP_005761354.1 hypothetical protein EMIHUDRAFT_459933 [Emiliania huxleyi CCMP1516]
MSLLAAPTRQALLSLLPALTPTNRQSAAIACTRPEPSTIASADASCSRPELLTSYGQLVGSLVDEVALATAGDTVELGLYLLEGGDSSARVLDALETAGGRGVHVSFVLDVSYVSEISRLIERTDTLIPRVAELARRHDWCDVTYRSKPDHAKYALFARRAGEAAILGGINLGDRFDDWEDFAVRLPPPQAERLRLSLLLGDLLSPLRSSWPDGAEDVLVGGECDVDAGASGGGGGACDGRYLPRASLSLAPPAVEFVCNRREQGRREISGETRGAVALALRRGAVVELLLPECANVYAHENRKAAQALLDGGWPTLRLFLSPVMGDLAFLGSANLVRGSMNLPVHQGLLPYDELNVLVADAEFCATLDSALDKLFARARPIAPGHDLLAEPGWSDPKGRAYSDARAQWEELWQ